MTQMPHITERSKNPARLTARRSPWILAGKRLSGSRFVTATSRIRFVQQLFQIGHAFLVRPYLLPAFFALFYPFLKFRQFLFGYVPVDDLLPVSPDKVMIEVLFSPVLFPADIEGALGVVFRLGKRSEERRVGKEC